MELTWRKNGLLFLLQQNSLLEDCCLFTPSHILKSFILFSCVVFLFKISYFIILFLSFGFCVLISFLLSFVIHIKFYKEITLINAWNSWLKCLELKFYQCQNNYRSAAMWDVCYLSQHCLAFLRALFFVVQEDQSRAFCAVLVPIPLYFIL